MFWTITLAVWVVVVGASTPGFSNVLDHNRALPSAKWKPWCELSSALSTQQQTRLCNSWIGPYGFLFAEIVGDSGSIEPAVRESSIRRRRGCMHICGIGNEWGP